MDPTALTVLVFAMATFEGTPGDRNWRNKNPCNLKWEGQRHTLGKDAEGFAVFDTLEHGFEAAEKQILLDIRRNPHLTIRELIDLWAPPSDGNPNNEKYAALASAALGVPPSTALALALDVI